MASYYEKWFDLSETEIKTILEDYKKSIQLKSSFMPAAEGAEPHTFAGFI